MNKPLCDYEEPLCDYEDLCAAHPEDMESVFEWLRLRNNHMFLPTGVEYHRNKKYHRVVCVAFGYHVDDTENVFEDNPPLTCKSCGEEIVYSTSVRPLMFFHEDTQPALTLCCSCLRREHDDYFGACIKPAKRTS